LHLSSKLQSRIDLKRSYPHLARKWTNLSQPGALHFVTGNFLNRWHVFTEDACCRVFLAELKELNEKWPSKLITYVLMPDHFHLISNPRDGRIKEFCGHLKAVAAKAIKELGWSAGWYSNQKKKE